MILFPQLTCIQHFSLNFMCNSWTLILFDSIFSILTLCCRENVTCRPSNDVRSAFLSLMWLLWSCFTGSSEPGAECLLPPWICTFSTRKLSGRHNRRAVSHLPLWWPGQKHSITCSVLICWNDFYESHLPLPFVVI